MTVASVVIILISTLLAYYGGTLFPIGLVFILLALLCSIGISIIYIIFYMKSKKFNLLMFSIVPIIILSIIGHVVGVERTKKIEQELTEIRHFVNSYYIDKNVLPDEKNVYFSKYNYKAKIIDNGNGSYTIFYYDAIAISDDDNIHFRPRP